MNAKIVLELNKREKDTLISALKAYHKYLKDMEKSPELKNAIKIVHDTTLARTEKMLDQLEEEL